MKMLYVTALIFVAAWLVQSEIDDWLQKTFLRTPKQNSDDIVRADLGREDHPASEILVIMDKLVSIPRHPH